MRALTIIILLLLLSFFKGQAQDMSMFENKYPTLNTFQSILFQPLKNYFELLRAKSIIYTFNDSFFSYHYTDPENGKKFVISIKIDRDITDTSISERVTFMLTNGQMFSFYFNRRGLSLAPTPDEDLITLKIRATFKEDDLEIILPTFKQRLAFKKIDQQEVASLSIGTFGFELKIEKLIAPVPRLNYLFFYKDMPSPQSFLTVKKSSDTNSVSSSYVHLGRLGEITPKEFFTGINEVSGAFIGASQEAKGMLLLKGFPKL